MIWYFLINVKLIPINKSENIKISAIFLKGIIHHISAYTVKFDFTHLINKNAYGFEKNMSVVNYLI